MKIKFFKTSFRLDGEFWRFKVKNKMGLPVLSISSHSTTFFFHLRIGFDMSKYEKENLNLSILSKIFGVFTIAAKFDGWSRKVKKKLKN